MKKPGEKSTISEVSIWPSTSAELDGRVCGGKLGTPGVALCGFESDKI